MRELSLGLLLGSALGIVAVAYSVSEEINGMWREAIGRGYAEYCAMTDEFVWVGECRK